MESIRSCPIKWKFLQPKYSFHPLPIAAIFCLRVGNGLIKNGALPLHQRISTTILKSSIPSHGIDVSKNQFHNGIYFSQGIDSFLDETKQNTWRR
jgi:hypothetical protein